jgi:hypothetical protein
VRVLAGVLAAAVCAGALDAQAPAPSQDDQIVRYGITKSKDTVTVGEPFEIRVRVRAPADASLRFPDNPDTSGTVQGRDPRVIETADSVNALDQTAVYRVAAWDIGTQPVRLADAVVTWPGGERNIVLDGVAVFVRTVLPEDSTLHVPKPARPLWETRAFPWWLLAALLAAIAIGVLIWWWLRRRRKPRAPVVVDPYVRAQREFNRLEAMGLVDAGERTRFVALAIEVLRDYIAARYPDASLALTSRELVAVMRRHPMVPLEQLSKVLHEADLAKFAAWSLTEERARSLAKEARALVEHEHRASQPKQAAA